jgi:hypothetical protein
MWLALLLSLAAFAAHASYFGSWLIDDAGISFAYARNLAAGAGLTSQPSAAPVEGFSNPAWTLTLSALYRVVDVREPGTLKLLAFLLVVPVFVVIWRDMAEARPRIVVATALGVLAACSPFVIWTISGLENALLACLVVASCGLARDHAVRLEPAGRLDALAGALAALAALARPDAILYAPLYPATVAVVCVAAGRYRDLARRWLAMAAGFAPIFFGYLTFRVAFFGEWVPNTFYAKGRPSITGLLAPRKFLELAESAFGDFMWPALIVGAVYVALLLVRRRLSRRTGVLVGYTGVAAAAYLMMPLDWMGEHRFATAFFPLAYWLVADLVATAWPGAGWPRSRMAALGAAVVTLLFAAQAATIFAARSRVFAANPPVPLEDTRRIGGRGFNRLAEQLDIDHPSLLTPDLGGVLLESRLRVYDLAGLCDTVIARAQGSDGDIAALHRYVFETTRPTFIHTSGSFQRTARLYEDPRLGTDYVPLHESWDVPAPWAARWPEQGASPPWWADYVRRDALGPDLEKLEALRATYRRLHMDAYEPWIASPDRLRSGWPQMTWAVRVLHGRG